MRINQVKSIQGGRWYYRDFYAPSGNPYKQGVRQLNALCNHLERGPLLTWSFTKRVIVALPYITRAEWEDRGFHRQFSAPPILFKDDLEDIDAISKIENYYIYRARKPVDDEQCDRIKKFFQIKNGKQQEISYDANYSILFVLPDESHFKERVKDIYRLLEKGIKIFQFCNFDTDKSWVKKQKDLIESFQLQIFKTDVSDDPDIKDEYIICDGKKASYTPLSINILW